MVKQLLLSFSALLLHQTVWANPESFDNFDCLLVPEKEVDVSTSQNGIIDSINVDKGDLVKKGQILLTLESSVEKASAELALAKTKMSHEITAAESNLKVAQGNLKRIISLHKQKVVSETDHDDAITELNIAKLNLEQAIQNQKLAQLDYERSLAVLEKNNILSKIDGVVVERYLDPGESVKDQKILKIAKTNPLLVEVIVPSEYFGKIKHGTSATVYPEIDPSASYQAKVIIVDKVIEASSGTFVVKLSFPNPDFAVPSGQNCKIKFDIDLPKSQQDNTLDSLDEF